ncbi:MAG: P-loop NTPase fold protein [Deferribacterales bacterium]
MSEIDNIFEKDKLNRKETIENLTNLAKNTEEPFVLCIDAPWGGGKTFFVDLWQEYLNGQNAKSIKFNAWENDFSKEPFISLMGEITSQIIETDAVSEIKDKLIESGKKVIWNGLRIGVKALTAGVLDLKEVRDCLPDGTLDSIGNDVSSLIETTIIEYAQQKQTRDDFKNILEKYAEKVKTETGFPLIFFIDELDRCRPDYAVELLESVKHLFYVKNIFFVLSVDYKQLSNSIKTLYGYKMDSERYLKRFINVLFHLSNDNIKNYLSLFDTRDYLNTQYCKNFKLDFKEYIIALNLNPRDVQRLFEMLDLIYKVNTDKEILCSAHMLLFLIGLKQSNLKMYGDIINNANKFYEKNKILTPVISKMGQNLKRYTSSLLYILTSDNNTIYEYIETLEYSMRRYYEDLLHFHQNVQLIQLIKVIEFASKFSSH